MNHFDPSLDPDIRSAREHFIDYREKQLQSVTVATVENGIKYLFLTNSGGAVAVLTYLGAIASNPSQQQALKYSLALFFVGVILVGIYRAYSAELYGSIFRKFQESTKNYFSSQQEWDEYFKEIQSHTKPNNLARIIVYSSFACFILGCLFGASSLFTWCV